MEKKGYSIRVKIGQHELAIEAEEAGFVQAMLHELKERFFNEIQRSWAPPAVAEVKPVEAIPAQAPAPKGELARMLSRVKKHAHGVLIVLYYYKDRKAGLKPREIKEELLANGAGVPKSIPNTLRYLKERGFVELHGRLWRITEAGVKEAERLLG